MWHAHDGMGWWMVFGGVVGLVFLATVAWLLLTVFSSGFQPDTHRDLRSDGADSFEIVRRRYAAGKIDREEFQQILRDLEVHGNLARNGEGRHDQGPGSAS
jgi:uncharacterized membrane protein